MNQAYRAKASQKWDRARRQAFWSQLLASIEGKDASLLDFNEIAQRLNLRTSIYRGVQNVPLAKIVGSMGRYQDFTREFLPRTPEMAARWERVATLYMDPASGGLPPIELYKVGSSYFVKDGNHRVSIAHQLDIDTIEAYVWEYAQPVGMDEDTDLETLLLEAEHQQFLRQTHLDNLRPGHGIEITAAGGYDDLLRYISQYQWALGQIDDTMFPFEEAVAAWYDMIYEPVVQIIEQEGILEHFPDRTPADFCVWVLRHREHLADRYAEPVRYDQAARDIRTRFSGSWLARQWRRLAGILRRG